MLTMKNPETEIQNQISHIKNAVKAMEKNAKYGSYGNFLHDLGKIDSSITKLQGMLVGTHSVMKKYERILVPYDGSRYAKKALIEALEIAKAFQSKVYVLTVLEIASDVPPGFLNELVNKKLNKIKRDISVSKFLNKTKLQRQVDEYKKYGIDVNIEAVIGRASGSILKFSKNNKIELIVIGSKGLTGMQKLGTLGSVSRKVSEETKCPVLIIR